MAQRIHGDSRPRHASRPNIGGLIRVGKNEVTRQSRVALRTFRDHPRQATWLLLCSPFWLGSVTQPPTSWRRRQELADAAPSDEAGQHLTDRMDHLTRQIGRSWLIGSILRGLSLGMIVIMLWLLFSVLDWLPSPSTVGIIAMLAIGALCGAGYGVLAWPTRTMVARMLDRTFWLNERMVTAFERPARNDRLSRIQVADAANTFEDVVTDLPRSTWIPVREGVLGLILIGALTLVLLAGVSQRGVQALETAPVPQFLTASDRLATQQQPAQTPPVSEPPASDQASIAEIQERGRRSQSTREDLGVLGEALAKHPLTQPAAEAINNGDYAGAAEMLDESAQAVSEMSQGERDAFADDLEEAAASMSETNPELAQRTQETADAVREGGTEAEDAVHDLADEVESTGENVESQEDLAQELDEATDNPGGGQSSEGSEGGQQSEGESSGEQSGGAAGSDPGEGVAAEPGVANEDQQGEPGSSSEAGEGSTEEGAGSAPSDQGTGEQPGDTSGGSSTSGSNGEGESSSEGDKQGISGAPEDETGSSQGSGAGTGQSNANDQGASDTSVDNPSEPEEDPDAEVPAAGEAGDPPPSRGDRGESDDGRGSTSTGDGNLQLEGTSDEGVQAGGDSGTSSTGTGSDSSTASGDLETGNAAEAGPDSNRVPPSLRDIVRGFFDDEETP